MIHTILTIWAVASLPLALLVARCIQPPTRHGRPVRQAVPADARWLDDQPLEVTLTRTEVDLRLRDIEAAESWTA